MPKPPPPWILRPGIPADAPALLALEAECFEGDLISPRSARRFLASPQARVAMAFDAQGRALGYALTLLRADTPFARLYSLAVAARARGIGLGSALLRAAEADAQAAGRRGLRLEVREDNAAAIAVYLRAGYRPAGTIPDYYEDGATARRYFKRLPEP
jgi:[ribosomal protein S18]-alanine N-acetyltransferase